MTLLVADEGIRIERFELSGGSAPRTFTANSYIMTCPHTLRSAVIDAPGETEKVLDALQGATPSLIIITHSHFDHTFGLKELQSSLNVPVAAHALDAAKLPLKPDLLLSGDEVLTVGEIRLRVLHTPGHTPGSICLLTENYLLAGDTIFPHGPGHTNTPADFEHIVDSLKRNIFVLPDETRIFSGHGVETVLKTEKAEFEVFSSRPRRGDLSGDVLWLSAAE